MAKETLITAADSLTLYQVVRRQADGLFYNFHAAAWSAFDTANWAYFASSALTKTVLSTGNLASYSRNFAESAGAAGTFRIDVYQQAGGSPAQPADGAPKWSLWLYWDGTKEVTADNAIIKAAQGVSLNAGGSTTNGGAAASFTVVGGTTWANTLTLTGLDSTGWTEMVLTIKVNPSTDEDAAALVLVKVSNPGAGGDGLVTFRGLPATDATQASLVVSGYSPDTIVSWTLKPAALNLLPSASNAAYTWELMRYSAAGRLQLATGKLAVVRSVLRQTTAV